MTSQNIRRQFLKYFEEHAGNSGDKKGHAILPSSPVLPHEDPTLLFTNAGMNQFKDVFLGKSARDFKKAATSQKCIRVGGKHNDLDNVGHTKRHLTFFEMLGNFSFGDYFKADAIAFAWEVATKVFGFEESRIWPTVFRDDDEAFEMWTKYVPKERITRFGESENFWSMGDTGPCGPCSELLYDRGPKYGTATCPKEDVDGERFLEFWNLVFMQYNRSSDGTMTPLPKPSIDTGAGLERIVSLKMDVENVFQTDILGGLIKQIEIVSLVSYDGKDQKIAPAFHVIADHLRCLAFAIADGVQPSNVERGYVLRKVLRRAVRYGRMLGMDQPFLAKVLPKLIALMGEDYPELIKNEARIAELLTVEEESFIRTLRRGGNILQQVIDHARRHGHKITGEDAFKLKDTYGFPLEEVMLIAKDSDLTVDIDRYQELEKEAKERSKKAHKVTEQMASENLFENFAKTHGITGFLGYQHLECKAKVLAIVVDNQFVDKMHEGEEGIIILDKTPFYAEMGGQVGDKGELFTSDMAFKVMDTQAPYKGLIGHIGTLHKGQLIIGANLGAKVDDELRQKIANNHTATHLLHWALQEVLGGHIKQAGSVVGPDRLRFDFSHHKALTPLEIRQIEDLVNTKIRENKSVNNYEISLKEAEKRGDIKQFFGDKYSDVVRVVDIDYSKELCGGTHTPQVGNIGYFRVLKESSIASGIRRIEGVTGADAEAFSRENEDLLIDMAEKLKTLPNKLKERIEKLVEENRVMTQELKGVRENKIREMSGGLMDQLEMINGKSVLIKSFTISPEELRLLSDSLMEKLPSGVIVLATDSEGKCQLICRVTADLVSKGTKALDIIKAIAPIIEGGGGGKADSAQAGGKAPHKIKEALLKARELV